MVGPILGPSGPTDDYISPPSPESETFTPQSPYSANRAQLRELTLPPIPNLDIPASPLGSPPASTNAKFAQFLELKKQGIHFNEKLAKSSALKNPSLMEKLMDFADIDDVEQYGNTLSRELWDPLAFPGWAYKEELAKSQQRILKKREEVKTAGQRDSLDFVPATTSGDSSRGGTPGASSGRLGPKSTAERVMAGLDRGRSNSPVTQSGMKRKTRFES
jgi:HCNGP-like protein